jgi:hypothetical protein
MQRKFLKKIARELGMNERAVSNILKKIKRKFMETLELYSLDEVNELIKEEVKKMFELQGGKPFMNIYGAAKYLC